MKLQRYIAEMVGAFSLTLAVSLSLLVKLPLVTPLMAALTLGLFVYTIGAVSGAHLNPAVTIAMASIKKISWGDALWYVLFQIAGAALAILVPQWFLGSTLTVAPSNEITVGIIEALGAFFLVFGVSAVTYGRVKSESSGVVVGGSLLLGILMAMNFSNGILNPAVAIGLGSISVMYLLGPVVGAVIAAWVYRYLQEK